MSRFAGRILMEQGPMAAARDAVRTARVHGAGILDAGVDGDPGETLLMRICNESYAGTRPETTAAEAVEAIGLLIGAGASLEAESCAEGSRPLHAACLRRSGRCVDVVSAMLRLGADASAEDDAGMTPMYMAANPDVSASPVSGVAEPGDTAVAAGLIRILAAAGADPNHPVRGNHDRRPLHEAARHEDPAAVVALLAAGADHRLCQCGALTPLMEAATFGGHLTVAALLDAGADPMVATTDAMRGSGHVDPRLPAMATALDMAAGRDGDADLVLGLLVGRLSPADAGRLIGQDASDRPWIQHVAMRLLAIASASEG